MFSDSLTWEAKPKHQPYLIHMRKLLALSIAFFSTFSMTSIKSTIRNIVGGGSVAESSRHPAPIPRTKDTKRLTGGQKKTFIAPSDWMDKLNAKLIANARKPYSPSSR